jgi:hypothetical protein
MSDIIKNARLAAAAQLDLDAAMKTLEAATLRGNTQAVIDARQRAHDILDLLLDFKAGAMIEALKK